MSPVSIGKVPVVPGVGIEFDWGAVSPEELTYRLAAFAEYLEDTQLLAETIKPMLQHDMAERFDTETDPSGKPWKPLVRPAETQIGILQLSGDMRDKAVSDAPWEATPVGIFFDTTKLPEYWAIHDFGYSARIPRRQFIGVSEEEANSVQAVGYEWMGRGMDIAFGGDVLRAQESGKFTSMLKFGGSKAGITTNIGRGSLGRFTKIK